MILCHCLLDMTGANSRLGAGYIFTESGYEKAFLKDMEVSLLLSEVCVPVDTKLCCLFNKTVSD